MVCGPHLTLTLAQTQTLTLTLTRYVGLVGDELRAPPLPPMFDAAEFDALVLELGSHYVL